VVHTLFEYSGTQERSVSPRKIEKVVQTWPVITSSRLSRDVCSPHGEFNPERLFGPAPKAVVDHLNIARAFVLRMRSRL